MTSWQKPISLIPSSNISGVEACKKEAVDKVIYATEANLILISSA